jgi:hypothetical protein
MSTKSQGFQFKLTNVSGFSFNSRTRQLVKKPISNIIYIKTPPDDAVKLEYVGSKEITPSNNLYIADYSDTIFSNARNNTVQEFIGETNASNIAISNKNFIVTQEFIEDTNKEIPLYYRHELDSSIDPSSIKVFNKNFEPYSSNNYKVVTVYEYNEDTGLKQDTIEKYYIFNSLESSYNETTQEYEIYFVQYVNSSGEVVTELLSNTNAYHEATYEDYWFAYPGRLKPWSYAYFIQEETFFSDSYIVTLPASKKYSVKYLEKNRVRVVKPLGFSDEEPWFPRIINGGFVNGYYQYLSKYDIREFSNQSFNPIEPYKLISRSKAQKVTDNLIKLPNSNIILGSIYSPLEIVIEKSGDILYAITSDQTKDGDTYYDFDGQRVTLSDGSTLTWSYDNLLGIDTYSGFVFLNIEILDSYDIYTTYTYREEYYTLSSLFMNPIYDNDVTSQIRPIYIVPRNLRNKNSTTQEGSVKYLKVSRNDTILECNQDGRDGNENININTKLTDSNGYSISGVIGLSYSQYTTTLTTSSVDFSTDNVIYVSSTEDFPRTGWLRVLDSDNYYKYFKYTQKNTGSFTISTSSDEAPSSGIISSGETVELVNFIDERTSLSRRVGIDEITTNGEPILPSVYCQYFIIGELSINPPHGIEGLTRIDIREDGGGIKEDKYEEAKMINPEVQWLNDFCNFDGQPYPGDAVAVVKLPVSIKENYSLDQIKTIVKENLPMGIYPLIRFYGYKPRIISIVSNIGSITVNWEKEGPEFVYDIWYCKQQNGEYQKANITRIVDDETEEYNSYTISSLDSNIQYYIKVTMKDKYYQWWYSYSSGSSIEGGLGLSENAPSPPFGNVARFQFNIII